MIAVGGGREAPAGSGLEAVLAHEAADLLVIDDHALLMESGPDATPALVLELVADRSHSLDNGGVIGCTDRLIVEGGAGDVHQPASLGNADSRGPATADAGFPNAVIAFRRPTL